MNPLSSNRAVPRGRQRGAVTLVITMLILVAVALGALTVYGLQQPVIIGFFVAALAVGILMTLPIGGADMPVVISLYNALTGLAVAFEGYVLGNEALIIAGMMVGAAGILLTKLMAKAMNRSIQSVLFSNFGATGEAATSRSHPAADAAANRSRRAWRTRATAAGCARRTRHRLRPGSKAALRRLPARSCAAGCADPVHGPRRRLAHRRQGQPWRDHGGQCVV